jgi:hypothetical protein
MYKVWGKAASIIGGKKKVELIKCELRGIEELKTLLCKSLDYLVT